VKPERNLGAAKHFTEKQVIPIFQSQTPAFCKSVLDSTLNFAGKTAERTSAQWLNKHSQTASENSLQPQLALQLRKKR
jgi:hypothetical protein